MSKGLGKGTVISLSSVKSTKTVGVCGMSAIFARVVTFELLLELLLESTG